MKNFSFFFIWRFFFRKSRAEKWREFMTHPKLYSSCSLLLNFAAGRHYTLFSSSSTCEKSCKNVRFHFLIYILSTSRKTFFVHEGSNEEEPYMRVRECFSKVNVISFIYLSIKIISKYNTFMGDVLLHFTAPWVDIHMRAILLNSVFFVVGTYFSKKGKIWSN